MDTAHVLFVCTANQCRSPMAEGLLRARLAKVGLAETVAVSSAGLLPGGRAATPEAAEVAGEMGADLAAHRSQPLEGQLVDGADLVIGLAREHAREAIVLRPSAQTKVFTLKDLARRVAAAGARRPGESLDAYVARLGAGRNQGDLLGRSRDDDVADPIGRSIDVYRATATEIDEMLAALVAACWPDA